MSINNMMNKKLEELNQDDIMKELNNKRDE